MITPDMVKEWRREREKIHKPSTYMDFWEYNKVCYQCKGTGEKCYLCSNTGKWTPKHEKLRYDY